MQTIFKVPHRNKPYVILLKESLANKNLSFKAKGLLTYLIGLPTDWVVNLEQLSTVSRDRRDSVRSAVNELVKEGYINRTTQRDDRGRIAGRTLVVFESKLDNPRLSSPSTGNPSAGKATLQRIDSTKDKQTQRKEYYDPPNPILGLGSVDPSFFDDYWKNSHQTPTNPKRDNATETQSQEDVPY